MTGDTLQRNGNINQMQWRTRGRERQAYHFSYDYLDRLTGATDYDVTDAGAASSWARYTVNLTYADKRGNIASLQRRGTAPNGSCVTFGQIDNLTYAYEQNTNKISSITEGITSSTFKDFGFKPGNGTGVYEYDANGNMKTDPYKGMTVQYNHLDLPNLFTFGANTIEILYDAAGTKLRKVKKTGTTTNYTLDYIGGIEYINEIRDAIYHNEGRLKYTTPSTTRHEYTIQDHLGNTRISFTDLDANGVVNLTNNPLTNEVIEENHYYPFGLKMEGKWVNAEASNNRYLYNSKEWNSDFGLRMNDYGARWYDASIGRWWSVDPVPEPTISQSLYHYGNNNPILFVDLLGMTPSSFGCGCNDNNDKLKMPEESQPNPDRELYRQANENFMAVVQGIGQNEPPFWSWARRMMHSIGSPYYRLTRPFYDAYMSSNESDFSKGLFHFGYQTAFSYDMGVDGHLDNIQRDGFLEATASGLYGLTPFGMGQNLANLGIAAWNGDGFAQGQLLGIGALSLLGGFEFGQTTVYRVYGGGAKIYGKSYSFFNPKRFSNYRSFAGLPAVNSGEYLLIGKLPIKSLKIGRWRAAPLDGNPGGMPIELYQNLKQLNSYKIEKLKKPF